MTWLVANQIKKLSELKLCDMLDTKSVLQVATKLNMVSLTKQIESGVDEYINFINRHIIPSVH